MHVRRAILLFALVLGLAALAAAVSPSRDTSETAAGPPPQPPAVGVVPRTVVLEARPGAKPRVVRARAGDHLVVSVASPDGGLATVPDLGRTASVSPDAPARFDLLAPAAGRYDVMFQASGSAEPRRVGTLVTRP
jgi:hypothetical protein